MVINSTWEMVASNVISQPTSVVAKLSAIINIHKYKRFHEGQHFISMAMEVHGAPMHDMDCFFKECARLFHDRQLKNHLSLSFYIRNFRQHVSIIFYRTLASVIKKKIELGSDVCLRPPITIRSHYLHVGNIRGVVGEIAY